ncbi:IclR family transcriptional regulator [Variovorax sp. RA8]|uniref:IclR family transcriptional regulator n=1 Tax=Variovorax sp. (strain JCM 16519 / RA8) TaxID=662548 RepID=UPI001316E513|nr:IclR family transcriptional regulator [Variovorax sp. RA8]VTU27314.1 Acetate operon repressor [Variovorax sp. RA8]
MSGVMERTLAILERLATDVGGVSIAVLADELGMPRSAAHRLLGELADHGYVRQSRKRGDYVLTTKLVSLGLNYLKHSGVVDLCQPVLDRLAESSGELVRLGVVDVDHLTWVALSQGARSGLRYDPDMGIDAQLSCTASGFAWLSTLEEDDAIALVARQGIGRPERFGPNAPTSMNAVMKAVRQAGRQGFAIASESYARGLSAISAPIVRTGADAGAVGVIAISGPSARLTDQKMRGLVPDLLAAAADIAAASKASPLFDRAHASSSDEAALDPA